MAYSSLFYHISDDVGKLAGLFFGVFPCYDFTLPLIGWRVEFNERVSAGDFPGVGSQIALCPGRNRFLGCINDAPSGWNSGLAHLTAHGYQSRQNRFVSFIAVYGDPLNSQFA